MLQDLRMEQAEELESLTEQLREMTSSESNDENNAYSLHMAEQGTDAMEREKTFLQAQRVSDYIKKLDEAIRRIGDHTFGLCRICGLRLDSKRLMAVPVTQVCTVYKNTAKPCEPGRLHLEELGVNDDNSNE
jgi:RNA polymerase-binding transcription factor DksA